MAQISKAVVDSALRTTAFDKMDMTEFVKINDQTFGILLTDENGVERYVRIKAMVAKIDEDYTARELMESEIAEYREKQEKKAKAKAERAEKAKRDKERRAAEKVAE